MRFVHLPLTHGTSLNKELQARGIRDHPRQLVLAFVTRPDDVRAAQETLAGAFRESRLLGVTAAGALAGEGIHDRGTLLALLEFDSTDIEITWADRGQTDTDFELGRRLAEGILDRGPPDAALLWISDLACNGDAILGGLGSGGMRSPAFGALAADDLSYRRTAVFSRDRILERGAAAVVLRGAGLRIQGFHSLDWVALGRTLRVTSARDSQIESLDGIPALTVLQRYLGKKAPDRFVRLSAQFPLIVERRGHEVARRCVGVADESALRFSGSFSNGDLVRFGLGNLEQALQSIRTVQRDLAQLAPEAILLLPSAARRRLLRACSELEVHGYPDIAPTAGMFGYGQFFHDGSGNEFSNNLLLAVGLSEGAGEGRNGPGHRSSVDSRPPHGSTTQMELEAIAQLAIAANQDLKHLNDSLEQLATTDPLTEVYNRRKIQALLDQELARVRRYGTRSALIMLDLDDFKQINDAYGHDVGDLILRSVTTAIREQLRTTDAIGRWGGEEFLVLCRGTQLADAAQLAERIRRCVERAHEDTGNEITLSLGVTELAGTDTLHSLLSRADKALYAAKHGGKNAVRAIPPPGEP